MLELKKYYYLCGLLFRLGWIFWLLETAFFLVEQGWHWKATTIGERVCDTIVAVIWIKSGYFLVKCVRVIISMVLHTDKTSEQ